MSEGISIREYARRRGVSDTAVRKALKAGRIVALPDGKIDEVAANLAWQSNTDPSFQRGAQANRAEPIAPAPVQSRLSPRPSRPVVDDDDDDVDAPVDMATIPGIKREQEKEKLRKLRIKNDIDEGKLVDRIAAERHAFAVVAAVRDAFQDRPDREAAQIAARYELTEYTVGRILRDFVRVVLTDMVEAHK